MFQAVFLEHFFHHPFGRVFDRQEKGLVRDRWIQCITEDFHRST